MGRRIDVSQPMVLSTELTALTEMFQIEADDTLEQWYYANNGVFMPDRSITPLTLIPVLSAFDPDTSTVYTPSFSQVSWYVTEWNGTAYAESEITNTTDSSEASYVKLPSGYLKVKKNCGDGHSITIRCVATYIDPRDIATTSTVESSAIISTNRDATTIFPTIDILNEKCTLYSPLTDNSSLFTFQAVVMMQGADITNDVVVEWYACNADITTPVKIENMMCYVSGQGTATLVVDALYDENLTIIARAKQTAQGELFPSLAYRSLAWNVPMMDASAYSENGAAVRLSTKRMTFGTVINIRHSVLSDEKKEENILCEWKSRSASSSTETLLGWGQTVTADGEDLLNLQTKSTLVYPYLYLLGAKAEVMFDGDSVVYDNETVVQRTK